MKKVYVTLICGLVVSMFANCGKKDEEKKGGDSMSSHCYYSNQVNGQMNGQINGMNAAPGSACNYNYAAAGAGFQPTSNYAYASGYQMNYSGGSQLSCGMSQTGAQMMLVYSESKGTGCVDTARLQYSGQVATYTLNPMSQAFTLIATPTNLYMPQGYNAGWNSYYPTNTGYNNYSTGTTVLRACDGGDPCPGGMSCRSPMGPGFTSSIGICYYN